MRNGNYYIIRNTVFNKYLIFRGPLLAVPVDISFVISFVYFFLIPIYKIINTTAAKYSLIQIFSTTVKIKNNFPLLNNFQDTMERNTVQIKMDGI